MSETYKDLPHTGLPEKKTNLIKFRDPYASEIDLANQYDSYMASGKLDLAQTLLNDNPSLKECILNADIILTLLHDDIALQRIFFDDIETYIMSVIQYDKEYTEGKACSRYAVVPYNNQVYFCYEACPEGTLPTNSDYFYPITLKGEQGNPGINFVPMGAWVSGTAYNTNQAVTHNNILWYSTVDNNTEEPSDTSSAWAKAIALFQNASDVYMDNGDTVEETIQNVKNHLNNKFDFTLYANEWQGENSPFTQVISCPQASANSNGIIGLSPSSSFEQRVACRNALLAILSQDSGSITIVADGDKPLVDISCEVILLS